MFLQLRVDCSLSGSIKSLPTCPMYYRVICTGVRMAENNDVHCIIYVYVFIDFRLIS